MFEYDIDEQLETRFLDMLRGLLVEYCSASFKSAESFEITAKLVVNSKSVIPIGFKLQKLIPISFKNTTPSQELKTNTGIRPATPNSLIISRDNHTNLEKDLTADEESLCLPEIISPFRSAKQGTKGASLMNKRVTEEDRGKFKCRVGNS